MRRPPDGFMAVAHGQPHTALVRVTVAPLTRRAGFLDPMTRSLHPASQRSLQSDSWPQRWLHTLSTYYVPGSEPSRLTSSG